MACCGAPADIMARAVVSFFLACRAYGPGEVKVLTSADGGNFEEVVPWRRSTKGEAAYIETFMFAEPRNVMAVSILMRDPQRWRFMGITNVALLVEPGPFMLVSGAPASDGELCVVGRNGILEVQPCVAAIVAGDGAEIFSFGVDGELVSAPSKACASLSNGCVATRAVANLSWSGSAPMFIAALWPWSRAGQTLQHLSCKRRAKSKHPAMEMFVWLYPAARQTTSSQRLGALTLPSVSTRSTSSQCATLGQLGRWMHCCGSLPSFQGCRGRVRPPRRRQRVKHRRSGCCGVVALGSVGRRVAESWGFVWVGQCSRSSARCQRT